MRLYNPDRVILDALTFESLHLKSHTDIKGAISSSLNTCEKLEVPAHKGVSASWEGTERNFLAFVCLAIEEPEPAIKHPL